MRSRTSTRRCEAHVPERDAEHAAQVLDEVHAVLFVQVDDRFGVGLSRQAVALAHEVGADVLIVVDLAVEDDPDAPILVRNRLVPRRQIDDRQATHRQAYAGTGEIPLIVGTAVRQAPAHAAQQRLIVEPDESGDAAHRSAHRPAACAARWRRKGGALAGVGEHGLDGRQKVDARRPSRRARKAGEGAEHHVRVAGAVARPPWSGSRGCLPVAADSRATRSASRVGRPEQTL